MSATQLFLFHETKHERQSKQLSEILDCLNGIWSINYGGCGISALAIYRWSKQNESVSDRPFVFLWRENDEWEAENNDESLENGDLDSVEVPCHIAIELYAGLYDSEGLRDDDCYPFVIRQSYKLNESELLHVINSDGWNSSFNRANFIPQIEHDLGIDLSDVER